MIRIIKRKWNDPQIARLSDSICKCPNCNNESLRFDMDKRIFICWECCAVLTEEEARKKIDVDGYFSRYYRDRTSRGRLL